MPPYNVTNEPVVHYSNYTEPSVGRSAANPFASVFQSIFEAISGFAPQAFSQQNFSPYGSASNGPAGHGAPTGYGSPSGYGSPAGYGASMGYGLDQGSGYGAQMGYGGYGAGGGYGHTGGGMPMPIDGIGDGLPLAYGAGSTGTDGHAHGGTGSMGGMPGMGSMGGMPGMGGQNPDNGWMMLIGGFGTPPVGFFGSGSMPGMGGPAGMPGMGGLTGHDDGHAHDGTAGMPGMGEMAGMPGHDDGHAHGGTAGMPGMSEMAGMPGMGGMAGHDDGHAHGDMAGMPGMGGTAGMSGMTDPCEVGGADHHGVVGGAGVGGDGHAHATTGGAGVSGKPLGTIEYHGANGGTVAVSHLDMHDPAGNKYEIDPQAAYQSLIQGGFISPDQYAFTGSQTSTAGQSGKPAGQIEYHPVSATVAADYLDIHTPDGMKYEVDPTQVVTALQQGNFMAPAQVADPFGMGFFGYVGNGFYFGMGYGTPPGFNGGAGTMPAGGGYGSMPMTGSGYGGTMPMIGTATGGLPATDGHAHTH